MRHGFERPTMNQMMTGKYTPPAKTIWAIIEREGYKLADCIDLPEVLAKRRSQLATTEALLKENNGTGAVLSRFIEFLEWEKEHPDSEGVPAGDIRPPPEAVKKRRRVS